MTGAEHYAEAERLLRENDATERGSATDRSVLAEAHVHATLALAAATALSQDSEMNYLSAVAWHAAAATPRPEQEASQP